MCVFVGCASSKVVDLDSVQTCNEREIACTSMGPWVSSTWSVYEQDSCGKWKSCEKLSAGTCKSHRVTENAHVRSCGETGNEEKFDRIEDYFDLGQINLHRVCFTKSSQTKSHNLFHEIFISFSAFFWTLSPPRRVVKTTFNRIVRIICNVTVSHWWSIDPPPSCEYLLVMCVIICKNTGEVYSCTSFVVKK